MVRGDRALGVGPYCVGQADWWVANSGAPLHPAGAIYNLPGTGNGSRQTLPGDWRGSEVLTPFRGLPSNRNRQSSDLRRPS